jgi:hypothetical protein
MILPLEVSVLNSKFFASSPKHKVYHESELLVLFGPVPDPTTETEFANQMLDFYLNFIYNMDPGRELGILSPNIFRSY